MTKRNSRLQGGDSERSAAAAAAVSGLRSCGIANQCRARFIVRRFVSLCISLLAVNAQLLRRNSALRTRFNKRVVYVFKKAPGYFRNIAISSNANMLICKLQLKCAVSVYTANIKSGTPVSNMI